MQIPASRRPFSRHLPPLPVHPMPVAGWFFFAGLAAGLAAIAFHYPLPFIGFILFVTAGSWIISWFDTRRKQALAATRPGNAICQFARAFDLRFVDTWVVRAAFEELQPYFPYPLRPFPVQPSDRLVDDFNIDPDEIEFLARIISRRAGYSLECTERNPLYGRVDTVGDLVRFFTHQPKTRNA